MPRDDNKHVALATLVSRTDAPDEAKDVQITKRTFLSTTTDIIPNNLVDVQYWHSCCEEFEGTRDDELYHRGNGGVLARCISLAERKKSYIKFMNFHLAMMMSACIDDYRDKGILLAENDQLCY